eukprot:COSAG01_NODE_4127_length_5326_cov_3.238569_11_plen_374_part_00
MMRLAGWSAAFHDERLSHKRTLDPPVTMSTTNSSPAQQHSAPEGAAAAEGLRRCRCPLCGQMIIATNQDECVAHMEHCAAFVGVHGADGTSEPDVSYLTENVRGANGAAGEAAATSDMDDMLVLPPGSAVVLEGLGRAPELNGLCGCVESWDREAGRYRVRVEGRERALGVRPRHCRRVAHPAAAAAVGMAMGSAQCNGNGRPPDVKHEPVTGDAQAPQDGDGGWSGWAATSQVVSEDWRRRRMDVLTAMCGGAAQCVPEPEPEPGPAVETVTTTVTAAVPGVGGGLSLEERALVGGRLVAAARRWLRRRPANDVDPITLEPVRRWCESHSADRCRGPAMRARCDCCGWVELDGGLAERVRVEIMGSQKCVES